MSAPVPLHTPEFEITRTGLLAAASVVVATCSFAVTLAVAGGGGGGTDEPAATAGPRFATGINPDAATPLYHHRAMQRRR
jgi:hypothetical protein